MIRILFADNDPDFLSTRREFLEPAGYDIILASTPAEAEKHLLHGKIDLAILDIRLKDDGDEKDTSGLVLAKEVALSVPKIILTGYPSYETAREALGSSKINGLPPAVDYISKLDGPENLLEAVKKALLGRVQDVFIVHGHDTVARERLTHFIEHIGLHPVVLRDLPSNGQTIIAKIENYSNVGFVVVLLTPDDVGYAKRRPDQKNLRARQNVIFELGFFIGKLGPSRVCSLYKKGVEILSDYQGVVYIPMNSDEIWKLDLAREFKAARLKFDENKLI
jgi:predicted nucleotide-binding protein